VNGIPVKAGGRVSLCWASANQDETAFAAPEEVRLDRKPNPHVAFGFGSHLCLGAPHARLLLRTLLKEFADRVGGISVLGATEHVEIEKAYERTVGFESLTVKLLPVLG
jgi:cytochrome P450